VQETGQLGGFGQTPGRFFEQTDPHHSTVQIHQDLS
jgi:hypothetical protein